MRVRIENSGRRVETLDTEQEQGKAEIMINPSGKG